MKAARIFYLLAALTAAAAVITCGREGPDAPPDMTPPAVVATSPYYDEQNVPVNIGSITVTFTEEMDPATVNTDTISLMTGTAPVAGSVACEGATAVFSLHADLAPGSSYRLIVSGVKDSAGNVLTAPLILPFMTGAGVRTFTVTPSVQGSGTMDPGTPLQARYNETIVFAVVPAPGSHIVSAGGCGGVLSGQTYTTGPVKENCAVTAVFATDSVSGHTVIAAAGPNGTITPSGMMIVGHEAVQQFTVAPLPGYHIDSVSGCGGTQAGNTYTTGAITADCTVWASFAADVPATHLVTVNAGPGGTLSPAGPVLEPAHGASQTFTVSPDAGFHILSVTGCSGALAGTSYQTGPINADCTVTAVFAADAPARYLITAASGSNGAISPAGPVSVGGSSDISFAITADPGYSITSVRVDGIDIALQPGTTVFTYTFVKVTSDHTITASFDVTRHRIRATADANGAISPSGDVLVPGDADQSFAIMPAAGYLVDTVVVDSISVGPVSSYTFQRVAADHMIHASFAQHLFSITATAGENGTVTCSPSSVGYGSSSSCVITPDQGFSIINVIVDGGSTGPVDYYAFNSVTGDHTIHALFAGSSL